jgi:mannose-6-phosphate isomerase-like protein (cupin superfamily)
MRRYLVLAAGLASLLFAVPSAQAPVVTGDRATPLRPLAGGGNRGISNAVLRDQPEVRTLRVVVEPNGVREMHSHDDVKFHLFVPISGPMALNLEGGPSVTVTPWHPYFMNARTRHGFQNTGAAAVEIMEIFVR